ncbi:pyridoxal phosphate-dependent transferase [Xylaria palmicola]|nr:pyridoxal phosphate-dependent transferase [Xylaria palmicola]
MTTIALGDSIPPNTAHAVSVSLPTWKSNVGYEEGEKWVVDTMVTGYPRFYIHKAIQALAADIVAQHGRPGQAAMLFPTRRIAQRCVEFVRPRVEASVAADLTVLSFALDPTRDFAEPLRSIAPTVAAVVFAQDVFPIAKQYWQHSGDGVSSRRAEFCHNLLRDGLLVLDNRSPSPRSPQRLRRGPKRYQRTASIDETQRTNGHGHGYSTNGKPSPPAEELADSLESSRFLEERYGRNLDVSLVENAKSAIRRRIAGVLTTDLDLASKSLPAMAPGARGVADLQEHDIYLTPCGMNAIFTTHQALLRAEGPAPARRSVNFGFPYVDTLKILQKFGPGAIFYGHGSGADLDDLEARLRGGERILALFCEFPGNPLLTCPDLDRIRQLADAHDFAVVVDETIGTFVNVNVLPLADVVVSSLTKIFSGDCNVMGGSVVLNPASPRYAALKAAFADRDVFDPAAYWAEDAVFMERNSRDFAARVDRVNANAELIARVLRAHPLVARVYYPLYNESRPCYEARRLPAGGYGGLLSCVLRTPAHAVAFYDALATAKGPSLGTNFTLTSPYVILAHYQELDWAAGFGVDPSLLRVSVGLEDNLGDIFARALEAAEAVDCD